MTSGRTVHVRMQGRVQGVGFRAWTRAKAHDLGLTGWVRNRDDGAVEAVFQGDSDTIERMLRLCEEGPSFARVTSVQIIGEDAGPYDDFDVRP